MVTLTAQTLEQRVVRKVMSTEPPLTFTVEIRYHPDDNGYSAECMEMDAVAWGDTYEEVVENLLDVMLGLAEATMKLVRDYPNLKDRSVAHARFVLSLGSEEKLRKVLGL
jgi:predicted RNase H-like HicB family nuclease